VPVTIKIGISPVIERTNPRDQLHPAHVVQSIAHEDRIVRAAASESAGPRAGRRGRWSRSSRRGRTVRRTGPPRGHRLRRSGSISSWHLLAGAGTARTAAATPGEHEVGQCLWSASKHGQSVVVSGTRHS
jgi:hypothetical protein